MKKIFQILFSSTLILNSCATPEPQKITLNIFAAASLTDAFTEIGAIFESQHPDVDVVFNFAGSQQLAQQINAGAPADVFVSANRKQIDAVYPEHINAADVQPFLLNELVVIVPKDNPGQIKGLNDLTKPGIIVILASNEVPAGQYALRVLDNAGIKDQALANVVSYEDSVRSVLTKISLGEADAGIVYFSDALNNKDVLLLNIPPNINVIAKYLTAPISGSAKYDLAEAFIALILSNEVQEIFQRYGFSMPKS